MNEREIVRDLAKRYAEIALSDETKAKAANWGRLNALDSGRFNRRAIFRAAHTPPRRPSAAPALHNVERPAGGNLRFPPRSGAKIELVGARNATGKAGAVGRD